MNYSFDFFIVQLKSCFHSIKDFFRRHRFIQSDFVFVEKNIDLIKFFELKRIINKRMIIRREIKYLIKWKNYNSKYDIWKNLFKLNNIMNLIQKYKNSIRYMIDLFDRHRLSKSIILKKSFANQKIKTTNKKFLVNQQSSIIISIITSQSTFVLKSLIIVSRKFFSIILL